MNLRSISSTAVVSTVASNLPAVTSLICTRGRGDSLVPTVRSILHADSLSQELLIVDQSDDDSTACALAPFARDRRLRYLRTQTRGKGVALNLGLRAARNPIVAITDDDCEVDALWPLFHLQAFADHPRVIITYGNVLPVEHDPRQGFIPTYFVLKDKHCSTLWEKREARGIGANTAVRRDEVLALGGFDAELCPGGQFKACVDRDLTVRCVLAGYEVYETRESVVYHYGFRSWEQGRVLARNAFYGIGAAHIKPVRCGHIGALGLLAWEFGAYALGPSLKATLLMRRPLGWQRVVQFVRGMADGLRCDVDKERMLYIGKAARLGQELMEQELREMEHEGHRTASPF